MKVYEGKTQGTIHKYEATITLEVASNRRIYLNRAEEIKRFIKSFDIQFTAPNTIGTKDWRQYNLQVMNLDISDVEARLKAFKESTIKTEDTTTKTEESTLKVEKSTSEVQKFSKEELADLKKNTKWLCRNIN